MKGMVMKIESWHIRACKGQGHHLKSHSVAAALSRFDLSYLVTSADRVYVMIYIIFDRIITPGCDLFYHTVESQTIKINYMFNRLIRTPAVIYKLKKRKKKCG